MHSLKLLMTFEKLNLKHLDIGAKYQSLLQRLGNDIEHIRKVYSVFWYQVLDLFIHTFGMESFVNSPCIRNICEQSNYYKHLAYVMFFCSFNSISI